MKKITNLNIAIFIDRDVTIRHFLDSKVFTDIKKNNNVKLIFPPIGDKRISNHEDPEKFGYDYEFIKIPERRTQLWKWIFYIKILTYRRGADWKEIRKVFSLCNGKKMSIFFRISSLPIIRYFVINLIKFIINKYKIENLYSFFNDFKPHIIIHPSIFQGVYINELSLLSKEFDVPYILLMNSWDNPCLKNTSIYEPSIVGVWGEQTKFHAHKYMGLPQNKIKILGAAQFQCFNDEYIKTREMILKDYQFPSDTILILYAGSSQGNDEFRHLLYLQEICKELDKNIRIIYRAHPWLSDSETSRKILNLNSNIIKLDPLMVPLMKKILVETATSFFATDYKYTHDLLGAADIVISPLSTILIEALCHGKEAICLIPEDEESNIFFKNKKSLPCFKDVIESESISTIKNIENLKEVLIKSYKKCRDPENILINKKNSNYFVDMNYPPYKERLIECIDELLSNK